MRRARSSPDRAGPSLTNWCRCTPTARPGSRDGWGSSFAQDSAWPPEHDGDEECERDDVTPLEREEEAADRDELREDERGDETAEHVAEPAEHADQKRDRPERQADRRVDVVLQDQ